ncbi:MAG: hypothetical protein ACOY0T_13290 [Myxococcota bacterium]
MRSVQFRILTQRVPFLFFALVAACGSESKGSNDCNGTLLCDDFESYANGSEPTGKWQTRVSAGELAVDGARRHSGARSVRVSVQAGAGTKTAFLKLGAPVLPVAGNVLFGRVYAYLESVPQTSVHFTLIQAGGLVGNEGYHALYRYGGQQPVTDATGFVGNQWMANYETPDSYSGTGPSTDCWKHANRTVVPVGRWACIEWQFDGPANTLRLWQDGKELEDLTVEGAGHGCLHQVPLFPWTAPTFDQLELGFESYQTDEARVLYVDDVAVADHRIGCGG